LKIIFLDIDGVLVTRRFRERDPGKPLADPSCVAQLNRIVEATEARIVLSSSWRYHGLHEMRMILGLWGVRGEMIDLTPDLNREPEAGAGSRNCVPVPRGREIAEWLRLNDHDGSATIVILDDDADMEHLLPRLVKSDYAFGLTEAHAERAIEMLNC